MIRNAYYLDRTYVTINERDLFRKIDYFGVNKETYVPEEFDCDDFSIRLMDRLHEYAVGMVLLKLKDGTVMHSVNV
jgi:hypothetical protein